MMNYFQLKQIQQNERNSGILTKIPSNFYVGVANYFQAFDLTDLDDIQLREYHNAHNSYSEIVEKRLFKLSKNALYYVIRGNRLNQKPSLENMDDNIPLNINKEEVEMFNQLVNIYYTFYDNRYDDFLSSINEDGGEMK